MKLGTATTPLEFLFLTLWPDVFAEYSWRRHPEKNCSLSLQLLRLAQETMTIRWKTVIKISKSQLQRNREIILNHTAQKQKYQRKSWNYQHDTYRVYTAVVDTVQTKHWSERYVGREPNHSLSDLHVILSVHLVKKDEINVVIQSQAWKPFLPSDKAFRLIKQSGVTPDNLKYKFSVIIDEGCHLKVAKMLFPMTNNDLHPNPVWTELRDFYLEQWVCRETEESTGRQ